MFGWKSQGTNIEKIFNKNYKHILNLYYFKYSENIFCQKKFSIN